jgi:hypothetical protein
MREIVKIDSIVLWERKKGKEGGEIQHQLQSWSL